MIIKQIENGNWAYGHYFDGQFIVAFEENKKCDLMEKIHFINGGSNSSNAVNLFKEPIQEETTK